jgi:hypothetical protein
VTNLCSFALDSGRRCDAPALRNSDYCRHHDPSHPRRRSNTAAVAPARDPDAEPTRAATAAYWRSTFYRSILAQDLEGLQDHVEGLLEALGDRTICHRSAGRLFAAIEDRRRQLMREVEQAAMRKVQENLASLTCHDSRHDRLDPKNSKEIKEFEALRDLLSAELLRATGPQPENATS